MEISILENLPIGVFRTDEEGTIIYVNKALLNMIGYQSFEELSSINLEKTPQTDYPRTTIKDILKSRGQLLNLEAKWKTKSGKYIPVRESIVRTEQNGKIFYDGYIEPIPESIKPNQPLFLQTLLETIPYPIYYKDINGRFIGCNSHFESLTHIKKELLIGKSFIDIAYNNPSIQSFLVDEGSLLATQTTAEEKELIDNKGNKRNYVFTRTIFNNADGTKGGIVGIYIDVTDLKNIQNKLVDTESRYKQLFENANDAILVFEPQSEIIIDANPKASEVFGYSRQELIGTSLKSFTIDVARGEEAIKQILKTGSYKNFETRYRKKDGSIITVFANVSLLKIKGQDYILSINTDVSDIINLIQKLRNSEELYHALFDHSIDAVLLIENGQILTANSRAALSFNMKREELVGARFTALLPEAENGANKSLINLINSLEPGSTIANVQCTFSRKDGTLFYANANLNCFLLAERKIVQLVFEDITLQKLSQAEIIKLSRAIEQSSNTVLITDTNGIIEYVNPHFVISSGYSLEEIIGKNINSLSLILQSSVRYDEIWGQISRGNEWEGDVLNRKKSGDTYWARIRITPLRNEKGIITNYLLISEDITDKKLKDEQLQKYTREIEVMLKEIHHRVKNNLQIILSLIRLQSENIKDSEAIAQIKATENRIISMALVHEMLYSSESYSEIEFKNYVSKIIQNIFLSLSAKKIKVLNKIENIFLPIDIAIPCGLIINELITNSIKHAFKNTDTGVITIQMKSVEENYIQFQYKDNGPGIKDKTYFTNPKTLGLQLITTLSNQIGSSYSFSSREGFSFELTIPVNLYEKRL
ncbi:MAG: PAS domain S-box protein [Ignavibacteria bacterium]